jgi:hypothetical protein
LPQFSELLLYLYLLPSYPRRNVFWQKAQRLHARIRLCLIEPPSLRGTLLPYLYFSVSILTSFIVIVIAVVLIDADSCPLTLPVSIVCILQHVLSALANLFFSFGSYV